MYQLCLFTTFHLLIVSVLSLLYYILVYYSLNTEEHININVCLLWPNIIFIIICIYYTYFHC